MSLTESCQWINGFGELCGATPIAVVITGCVHEHLSECGVCELHLARVADGKVACERCADVGCPCSKVLMSARRVEVPA